MKANIIFIILAFLVNNTSFTQNISPGLDKDQLLEVMYISARTGIDKEHFSDSNKIPEPSNHKLAYRSSEMAFYNLWELWTSKQNTAIISVRGTIKEDVSWLSNFYAAMLPAKGRIILPDNYVFKYELSENPKAAVHSGWLISTAYLSREIIPKIDSCYNNGISDFIITGHSQGGGISYLLTAHLLKLREKGKIASNIRFKTYSTAAPKPGNLYFAYDYESQTPEGMAFNIINSSDWVPEVPVSIQTLDDFNNINPFNDISALTENSGLFEKLKLKYTYNRLKKIPCKARKNYIKYLGEKIESRAKEHLGEIQLPDYYPAFHYVRTGRSVVLNPDKTYKNKFPEDTTKLFLHHSHKSYINLIRKLEH